MSDHIKCNYCGSIADACAVCGDDSPLIGMLAESQARVTELESELQASGETSVARCNALIAEENRVKELEAEVKLALADRLNCDEPTTKVADTMTKNCGNCGYRVDPEKRLHNQPACERPIDNIDDSCRAHGKWIPQAPTQPLINKGG